MSDLEDPDLVSLSSGSEYDSLAIVSETTNFNMNRAVDADFTTTSAVAAGPLTTSDVVNLEVDCATDLEEGNFHETTCDITSRNSNEPLTGEGTSVLSCDPSSNDDTNLPGSGEQHADIVTSLNSIPTEEDNADMEDHTPDTDISGRVSPYLLVKKNLDVSMYESVGLLYASSPKAKDNRELMKPDEVAQDVLEVYEEEDFESLEELQQKHWLQDQTESNPSTQECSSIDPGALLDIERHAQFVATELNHVMDNLRNSLHAMTVCTKQSIGLHKESVDNLSVVIDTNVKAMYVFMAKFEELHRGLTPVHALVTQIREIDEKLKILERTLRVQ